MTKELITAQSGEVQAESTSNEYHESEHIDTKISEFETSPSSAASNTQDSVRRKRKYEDEVDIERRQPVKHWQVGEQCQALWHQDGQ